jgi:hypothetical protein
MGYKGELGVHSLIMIDDYTKLIWRELLGFERVLEQNPCSELVSMVKDSTLANWLEKSFRFLIVFII